MNGQVEPEEKITGPLYTCPFTISAIEDTRRVCIGPLCMGFLAFDPKNPENGGLCGRVYMRVIE